MIVDDELIICRLIEKLIDCDALGVELCPSFTTGAEALSFAKHEKPDIIITDINMPGIDGLELIRRLTEARVDASYIIISGYQSFEYAYTAIKYGVTNFLLKPINRIDLNNALESIIRKKDADENLRMRILEADQSASRSRQSMRKQILENLSLRSGQQASSVQLDNIRSYFELNGDAMRVGILQTDLAQGALVLAERLLPQIWTRFRALLSPLCCDLECTYENSSMLFLLNYPAGRETELMQHLGMALNEAMALAHDYRLTTVLALSAVFSNCVAIPAAYRQAYCAAQSRFVLGSNRILCADGLSFPPKYFIGFEKYRSSLLHSIEITDGALMSDALNALISDLHGYLEQYPYQTQAVYVQTLRDISALFTALRGETTDNSGASFRRCFKSCLNLDDFDRSLCDAAQGLFTRHYEEAQKSQNTSITIVKRYIDKHYAEPLSLEQLSGIVYLNPAYLGILFKKCEGIGFSDYLANYRIEKAKALIRETALPISQIAADVGYRDVRYFTKQFMMKVGIKPAEYRKIHSD